MEGIGGLIGLALIFVLASRFVANRAADETVRQIKTGEKRGIVHVGNSRPKTPQEQFTEAVRLALAAGITPDQIKDIVVKEVRQRVD